MYRIMTPYGTIYDIDEEGHFIRYNQHIFTDRLDKWMCAGIYEMIPFGQVRFIPLKRFIEMIVQKERFTFKNGNPRYTLADIDHGTHRMHGNVNCHGIKSAWVVE